MSDETRKDRLEEFFRTHLEHFEEDPGEGLFAEIAGNIPAKPGLWDTFKAWIMPGLGICLMAAVLFSLFQYFNVKNLSSQVDIQSQEIEGLKKQLEAFEENGFDSYKEEQSLNNITAKENNSFTHIIRKNQKQEINLANNTKTYKATKTGSTSKQSNFPEPKDVLNQELLVQSNRNNLLNFQAPGSGKIEGQNVAESEVQSHTFNFLDPFAPIPTLDFGLLEAKENSPDVKPLDATPKSFPHFYYTLFYEPLYMSEILPTPTTTIAGVPSVLEGFATSYGVMAGLRISERFSVQTGLGFRSIQTGLSNQAFSLVYSTSNSRVEADGSVTNDYTLGELEGKQITVAINNSLLNDGNDVLVGDPFSGRFSAQYALNYYYIPLWVKYHFKTKKVHFSPKVGAVYHALMGDNFRGASGTIFGGASNLNRLNFQELAINIPSAKNNYIELGLGFGVQYELTSAIKIGLDPTYYRSLQPIFENKAWSLGFNANISYQIN